MARRLTQAMSFFMTTTMFEEIQKVSEEGVVLSFSTAPISDQGLLTLEENN